MKHISLKIRIHFLAFEKASLNQKITFYSYVLNCKPQNYRPYHS